MKLFDFFRRKLTPVAAAPAVLPPVIATVPEWMLRPLSLPAWAKVVPSERVDAGKLSIKIEIDTRRAYAEWRTLLGTPTLDQYWLEVIHQCAKLDVQSALDGTAYDPRACNKSAELHFLRANEYAFANHPEGRGIKVASRGGEAREHYKRVRGRLPF